MCDLKKKSLGFDRSKCNICFTPYYTTYIEIG